MLNGSSSSQFYTNAMHHPMITGAPPPTLHDSMILLQNLKLNATTPTSGETPKLYHYCYVCNTQLNSCKQALLHCSGKRHRKKLTFLQSRTATTTSKYPGIDQHLPPTTTIHPPPHQLIAQQQLSIQQYMSTGQQPPPAYYHHLSPALMAGTEQWLHQPQQQSTPTTSASPYLMHPHPLVFAAAPPTPYSSTSARMLPAGGNRSAVILPSPDAATDQSCRETGGRYKCETCSAGFATGALLHSHLQSAMHYKHHAHHFHCSTTSTNGGGSTIGASGDNANGIGDGSETDSTSTSTTASIFYCSQCSIAVNSQTQLQSHHAGSRHRHRLRANNATDETTTGAVDEMVNENAPASPTQIRQQHHSRSSSTSSIELATTHHHAGDIIVESGYTSGSGDEAALLLLRVNGLVTDPITSFYTCQLCDVTLSSIVHARQHLTSPKHVQQMSTIVGAAAPASPSSRQSSFRRKSSHNNSLRNKKNSHKSAAICVDTDEQTDDAPVVVEEAVDGTNRIDINFQQSTIDLCDDDIVCNVSDSGSL